MTAASATPARAGQPGAGLQTDAVYCMDALELLRALPDASVDCVLIDPPYATLEIAWDNHLDWPAMWIELARIITKKGAILITAQNPFAAELVVSNRKMFRYEWIWEKTRATGFVNAACQPLRAHEQVLVFSHSLHVNGAHADRLMNYYPQMSKGEPYPARAQSTSVVHYKNAKRSVLGSLNGDRHPRSVVKVSNSNNDSSHPTQKPLELFRYLIRTYTLPGQLVVDPCVGSGTTALAARAEGRHYIVGDSSAEYVAVTEKRLAIPYTLPMLGLFESEAG